MEIIVTIIISFLLLTGITYGIITYLKGHIKSEIDNIREEYRENHELVRNELNTKREALRKEHFERLVASIGSAIVELDEDKRYILSVDTNMKDSEFEEMVTGINEHLDLEDSDVKVVITNSEIRIIEFE